jgi:hypothetical protein
MDRLEAVAAAEVGWLAAALEPCPVAEPAATLEGAAALEDAAALLVVAGLGPDEGLTAAALPGLVAAPEED